MDRRDFLKLGGMMLGAAGTMGLPSSVRATMEQGYEAAILAEKPVYRPDGWKGARVKTLDWIGGSFDINNPQQVDLNKCDSLGSSTIVGPITRRHEIEGGFKRFDTGYYGDPAELRKKAGAQYYSPMGDALVFGARATGTEAMVDGPPRPQKLPIPDPVTMARHIKDMAMFLGADDCGIGVLPVQAVYTHQTATYEEMRNGVPRAQDKEIVNTHPFAVVLLYNQDFKTTTMASNGYDGGTFGSRRAYLYNGIMSDVLARYIRNFGYEARSHHNENYQVMVPPILIAAGMGELSRVGDCVLHPYLGYNYKAAVVTTNMPLMPDKPIEFGVQEFCRVCKKCAQLCPSKAISMETEREPYNGYLKYPLDAKACTIFRRTNPEGYGCGRCAVVCPWSSKEDSWFHYMGSYLSSMKSSALNRLIVQMDDICGYGSEVATELKSWIGFTSVGRI